MPDSSFNPAILILAAGKGTRMHSDEPKVLKKMLEEPMLRYVLQALAPLSSLKEGGLWTLIGHGAELVRGHFANGTTSFILQSEQLGTAHALATAWAELKSKNFSHILVVNGDTPLIRTSPMENFLDHCAKSNADLAFITLTTPDPASFGRVLRIDGRVAAIIEAKDYDESLHGPCPREINSGIYCLKTSILDELLPAIGNDNKSGEYYITDLIALAVARGLRVEGIEARSETGSDVNLLGVNTPAELVRAEEILRERIVREHLRAGVLIHNPGAVRIGPHVRIEPGCELTGPLEIYGESHIAEGVRLDSHSRLKDVRIAANAEIRSFCHLEEAEVGPSCLVGPYARMRPGAVMEEGAHLGNFVEMKKARLRKGAKANHLAYLGDAVIGERSNIGAGVITCNYDGKNKNLTIIGDDAFIGSNASLVAPVKIGGGSLIGAGSVITREVEENTLAIGRARQNNMPLRKK